MTCIGAGFEKELGFVCRFGNADAPQSFVVSSSKLLCISVAHSPGNVTFSISSPSSVSDVSSFRFLIVSDGLSQEKAVMYSAAYESFYLDQVAPSMSVTVGGTQLTVLGREFPNPKTGTLHCQACRGSQVVNFTLMVFVSSSMGLCLSPRVAHDGAYKFALGWKGSSDYAEGRSVEFAYFKHPSIQSVLPSLLVSSGGCLVTLIGSDFSAASELLCRFGTTTLSRARWLSSSSAACTSPEGLVGNVSLEISSNGVDFSHSGMRVLFSAGRLWRAIPTQGPVSGGTRVTLTGNGVADLDGTRVLFGSVLVDAIEVTARAMVILSPPGRRGAVRLAFFGSDELDSFFEYQDEARILLIQPSSGSAGGGSVVTLTGSGFVGTHGSGYFVRVGDVAVTGAKLISWSRVVLTMPTCHALSGPVPVEVSNNNGHDYSSSGITYRYRSPLELVRIEPSSGPAGGGIEVTCIGAGFQNSLDLACSFGVFVFERVVFRSESMVTCRLPGSLIGNLSVMVFDLLGNRDSLLFSNPVKLEIFEAPVLERVYPTVGFVKGGQIVTVVFSNNIPCSAAACFFGELKVYGLCNSNDTSFMCLVPPLDGPGVVPFQASLDSTPLCSSKECYFEYINPSRIFNIFPRSMPYNTCLEITVVGESISKLSSGCIFNNDVIANIFWISSTVCRCQIPVNMSGLERSITVNLNTSIEPDWPLDFHYVPEYLGFFIMKSNRRLHVYGNHFPSNKNPLCKFGFLAVTHGEYSSSSSIICPIPPKLHGSLALEISYDGIDFSSSGMLYSSSRIEHIYLYPSRGPVHGGTKITVVGADAAWNNAWCYFGDERRPLQQLSSHIFCRSPAFSRGKVQVRLSNTKLMEYFDFEFEDEAYPVSIYPSTCGLMGKSVVTITGMNFLPKIYCYFSEISVQEKDIFWVSSTLLKMVVPAAESAVAIFVMITNFIEASNLNNLLSFKYISPVLILRVEPTLASTDVHAGGVQVTVYAQNVAHDQPYVCKFGSLPIVDAVVLSPSSIFCLANIFISGNYSVNIGMYDTENFVSGGHIMICDQLQFNTIYPAVFQKDLGGLATVTGVNFRPSAKIACLFGTESSIANVLTHSALVCTVPFLQESSVLFSLMTSQNKVNGPVVQISFVSVVEIWGGWPSLGPAVGGTVVSIFGGRFSGSKLQCCVANGSVSVATQISISVVLCAIPPHSVGEQIQIFIQVDGIRSSQSFRYLYVPLIQLMGLEPTVIPANTISLVTVVGNGFSSSEVVYCKVGQGIAEGTVLSCSKVVCLVPSGAGGNCSIELSLDGVQFSNDGLLLVKTQTNSIFSLTPTTGTSEGGTEVTLVGSFQKKAYWCRFQYIVVQTTLVSGSILICISPSNSIGLKPFELFDSMDFPVFSTLFLYYAAPVVIALDPSFGSVQGGTFISVIGSNMQHGFQCLFSQTLSSTEYITSSLLVCITPPFERPSLVKVSVSIRGLNEICNIDFRYDNVPIIENLYPSSGPALGGKQVTVFGMNLVDGIRVLCRFGFNNPTPARYISGDRVVCITAPSPPANVSVAIALNGVDFYSAPAKYTVLSHVSVHDLYPSSGPTNGNTLLHIYGSFPSGHYSCRVGAIEFLAEESTFDEVICRVPPHSSGFVAVQISSNLADWSSTKRMFLYQPPAGIISISPSLGVLEGGTVVQVLGYGFFGSKLHCKFGMHVKEGTVYTDNHAECIAPQVSRSGLVEIEISKNSVDFSQNYLKYLYCAMEIVSFVPSAGSISGGLQVQILGSGFINTEALSCKFGDRSVPAIWISNQELHCVTPPGIQAEVDLEVSNNDMDFTAQGNKFEYLADLDVFLIIPSSGSFGGNVLITVIGTNFANSSDLHCKFGWISVPAKYFVSPSKIVCSSVSSTPGIISFQVSNNNLEYTKSSVLFWVTQKVFVSSLIPSSGPVNGQSIVTVIGDHFFNNSIALCKFGSITSPAYWITTSVVTCRTKSAVPGLVNVEVSMYGVEFSASSCNFLFYESINPVSLLPSFGQAYLGGTLVQIFASNLRNFGGLSCRFGSTVVPGRFISVSELECLAPPASPGIVPFDISLNLLDFSASGLSFLFQAVASVLSIMPNIGLDVGGTPVFVTGSNFVNSSAARCRFGSKVVVANFLSDSTLFCISPAQPPGAVDFATANNGMDFSNERLIFQFSVCPVGSFCSGSEVVQCPAGAYCPATGLSNFSICPPGQFQDKPGQASCLACNLGSVCPDFGMPLSQPCPPGYVCDEVGLVVPQKPCPPGYYCLTGTASNNTQDSTVRARPFPCPAGFYCAPGAVTSVSVIMNFTTPQPCFAGYYCSPGSETPHGQGPCPSGFHCPQYSPGMVQACPPGSFCPSVGNVDPLPCQPGSYNENFAQASCNICPIGRMCPSFGLLLPMLCPAGYVCDETGKATWSKLCPPGYWCAAGTLTANVSSSLEPKPRPCAPGTYCLIGVKTNRTVPGELDAAQICLEGTYCQSATGSPQGTAPCPRGYFCGSGFSMPSPAQPGYYDSRTGSVIQIPCTPGTYSAMEATINCIICPAGHSCMLDATTDPLSCPAGTYRSATDSVSCILCPTGTWSTKSGLTDMTLCEPCPPGVVCSIGGTTNLSLSSPCPEGYVCDTGTNSESQFKYKCPAGYFCDFGTTPATQYDFPCDAGYGCPEGTAYSTRNSLSCAAGYYCLAGSTSQKPLQTPCPIGTTSLEGAASVYECFNSGDSSICIVSPYYNDSFDPCLLKLKCWKVSPEDIAEQSTCYYEGIAEANYDFDGDLKNVALRDSNFLKLEAMATAVIQLDFRAVPIEMEYGNHFEVVVYYFNKTEGIQVDKVYDQCLYLTSTEDIYEDLFCQGYSGTWFGSTTVDKHGILEFTLLTHYEIWFRVEVAIVNGLYIENKNYTAFRQTMSVVFHYPTRANYLPQYELQNSSVTATRRNLQAGGDCVVVRNGITRPCSRLFFVTLDSADPNLNVALNVDVPFQPDPSDSNDWKFMTLPYIDFTTTNSSIPIVDRPFVTNLAEGIIGVGNKNSDAYPPGWSNRGPGSDNVGTGDNQMIVLSFLPFFSKCRGFDSHIPLFRVLEDERRDNIEGGCNLTKNGQGSYINQWDPLNSPSQDDLDLENIVDACHWIIQCSFEEQIDKTPLPQRWYTRGPGSVLFSFTRDAFNEYDYRNLDLFKSFSNTDLLVPAYVSTPDIPYDPSLVVSGVPRKVTLVLSYYQRDINTKRIVQASVALDDYEIPANASAPGAHDYTLEIDFKAISWSSLLNLFALDLEVYAVFYLLLGFSVVLFGAVFWAFNRLFTRLNSPPAFRLLSYVGLTTLPPIQGFLIALIPILAIVLFLEIIFNQITLLSLPNETFGNIADNLYGSGDATQMKRTDDGRFAVALTVVSFYAMFLTAKLLTPEKEKILIQEASRTTESELITDPSVWHRTHIVFSYCVSVAVYSAIFEYSYSSMMRNYFYTNLMLIYIFNIFYEAFLEELLGDDLMVKSHCVFTDLAVGIMTMAASSFLDFVQGYIIAMLLETAQRVYVDPGIDWLLERWEFLLRWYEKYKARREMLRDEEDADADDLEDDDLWMDVEDEQPVSPVEHILASYSAYSCGAVVMLYAPFVVLFLDWAEQHSGVGAAFGIKTSDFKFYWLFNFFSILPTMMRDVFVHNINELFHGWKVSNEDGLLFTYWFRA